MAAKRGNRGRHAAAGEAALRAALEPLAEEILSALLERLPPTITEALGEVTVYFEGRVPAWLLAEGTEPDTPGLFLGPSMRDPDARLADEPPVVYLFLLNLWEYSEENEEVFAGEIERTLLHEFGHFLGLEEEEMPGRDLD